MNLRAVLRFGATLLALIFIAAMISSLFPGRYWVFESLSNLRVQFAWLGFIFALGLFALRLRLLALVSLLSGLFCTYLVLSIPRPPHQPIATVTGTKLRVMTVNIDFTHHDADKLAQIIAADHPDVLVLIEDLPAVRRAIATRLGYLPYHAETGIDVRAISIDSRYPIKDARVESTDFVAHILTVTLLLPSASGTQKIKLIATHPLAPIRRWRAKQRKRALDHIAELASGAHRPVILMGDLNTTPHSPYFAELERSGQLVDTARSRSPAPTWIAPWIPLGLRVDHVLVSSEIRPVARHVSAGCGGDHRGLTVDLLVPPTVVP